jgi:acetylornithine deacetylase/succinyl-diaminopimelate desuccinylase-like protein
VKHQVEPLFECSLSVCEGRTPCRNPRTLHNDCPTTQELTMNTLSKEQFEQIFEKEWSRFYKEWSTFLSFPSVSADPSYSDHCTACAEWLRDHVTALGFRAELIPTPGKPIVFAEREGDPAYPTVVFYGHYDVQPPDPLDLWKSDPFRAEERGGRIYARGAQDNKGQSFYFLKAAETLIRSGRLRAPLKIVLEGEEECGSHGISQVLPVIGEKAKGDILMVCDTGTLDAAHGSITMGLRGLVALEIALSGPLQDLHSGAHGGMVKNPAAELSKLIASCYRDDGSVAIAGFYDDLEEVSEEDRALANRIPFDLDRYASRVGVPAIGGESGYTWAERRGFRPTFEVNGLFSGYSGPGGKTIIPSRAGAKFTARLGSGQDPDRCLSRIIEHLETHTPQGVKLEIVYTDVAGPAFRMSAASPLVRRASEVLQAVTGNETLYLWEGGSVPIVPELQRATGADPLLVGFALDEDNMHGPNESFALDQFRRGFLYVSLFLSSLPPRNG